jgi:cysteine desulfurase
MVDRVYLDHASSSPLRPVALEAMLPFLRDHHADAGRVHSDGRVTRVAIEAAREQLAQLINCRPREIVFTSGGTEAVNAAVTGATGHDPGRRGIVTTAVEHSSVLDACRRAYTELWVVGVSADGRFAPDAVLDAITPATALVSVQAANHEVGTVQDISEICAEARDLGVLTHVDACAAIGYAPVSFGTLGADLMSVTAHTWGGPKGTGALVIRRGLRLDPFIVGGAQERARRAGIENVPAIVGFGAAAADTAAAEHAAAREFTDRIRVGLADTVTGLSFHGHRTDRISNIVCVGVNGVEAEPILLALDQQGVAIHSGSACSSESLEPSPVLAAMGADADHALRISVGWSTTDADVDRFLAVFPDVVARLRDLRT